jgi:hypothetical protein
MPKPFDLDSLTRSHAILADAASAIFAAHIRPVPPEQEPDADYQDAYWYLRHAAQHVGMAMTHAMMRAPHRSMK